MTTGKILTFIFSFLFVGAFIFAITWGVINFNKVKEMMKGTGMYNQDDVNKSYEDGYNTALSDKSEYDELINGYRDTITNLTDNISQLNSQVQILTSSNSAYISQVANLESQKINLQTQVATLNSTISTNETTISGLNSQISSLQNQVTNLTAQGEQDQSTIASLNTQITNLTALKNQLMATNTSNDNTITVLNNQIITLNARISELSLQISNNSGNVSALNNRISQLEDTITYYESYIQSLQQQTQAVVTFEVDGSVYNIQIVNIGDYVSVTTPANTNNMIFNGWKVNNTLINLATYQITQNTRIVADITYRYDVNFVVDNTTYDTQYVVLNNSPTTPTAPTKTGYDFDGWSLDGVNVIDVTQQTITQNTTYYAVFTKVHTVTFMNGQNVVQTQSVRNGNYATNVTIPNTTYEVFNGWLLNNVTVYVSTYVITADTIFVADITYGYDVTFVVDNNIYDNQTVTSGSYAIVPTAPTKTGYIFIGWTISGRETIDVSNNPIISTTIYTAKFGLSLNNTSWSDIAIISNDIKVNNLTSSQVKSIYGWSVGDSKKIILSSNQEYSVRILGYNHDNLSSGNGKAGITFGINSLLKDKYKMNTTDTNVGGWGQSDMRINTMTTIFSQLPSDLQSVIVSVDKEVFEGYQSTNIITTSDKLWLFSGEEIGGNLAYIPRGEGSQYEYWQNKTGSGYSKYKMGIYSSGTWTYYDYWLRSPGFDSVLGFHHFRSSGSPGGVGNASTSKGVYFGFCI